MRFSHCDFVYLKIFSSRDILLKKIGWLPVLLWNLLIVYLL